MPSSPFKSILTAVTSLMAVLLCACGDAEIANSPTPAPTSRLATLPAQRSTLPPTWTPSFTPSPSATFTSTPTLAPTITRSAADICDSLTVLYEIPQGQYFPWEGAIPIMAAVEADAVFLRFSAVQRETGANKTVELPAGRGRMIVTELPVRLLPSPGVYDWTLSVYSESHGDLCPRTGTFRALRPRVEVEVTPAEAKK